MIRKRWIRFPIFGNKIITETLFRMIVDLNILKQFYENIKECPEKKNRFVNINFFH